MELLVVLLISAIIIVPIIIVCQKMRNQMISDGRIVNRDIHFAENAEIFTIQGLTDYSYVTEGVMNFDYKDIKCSLSGDKATQKFNFNGSDWSAILNLISADNNGILYRFEFTQFSSRNGIPYGALAMNKLETAVERLFLSIDPSAVVRTVPVEYKTKHNFF